MMFIKQKVQQLASLIRRFPLRFLFSAIGLVLIVLYFFVFVLEKPVRFSYAGETCIDRLILVPSSQRASSDDFLVYFEGEVKVGGVLLAATKVCVEPKHSLEPGTSSLSIAPFGGLLARNHFSVAIPSTPEVHTSDIVGKSISTAQPLNVRLTAADTIHQYRLAIGDKTTPCTHASAQLACDVAALHLEHGATYTAALHRLYKDEDIKLIEGSLTTLAPLALASSSITDAQVIYDAPSSLSLTFDRALTGADITLQKGTEAHTEKIATTQEINGAVLTLKFAELARETDYQVVLHEAIGDNGSSLAAPITLHFSTSGGPKVASVSVGANSVARNATITVTLDQPIDENIDIAKLARVEGVTGTVRKKSATQLTFSLQGGDCTAFKLVIDKGLKSGSNSAVSKEAWNFNSRTICGYSWVIGTSVQGRHIVAYSFGSGAKVLFFTGGMHGSEPSGTTTMLAWAQYLQANGDIIPADTRVVIVPHTNPDGIAANSRNNSHDVNIDRNFPTANWQASIETTRGTLPTGGGTSAGSEPETAALIALTRQLRPRLEVSFHAQGRLVGANKFGDSVAIGDIYAKTVGYKTMYYSAEEVMGYTMSGEYEDWMGESMNIPAILIELPSASGNYLAAQLPALKKMLSL